MNTRHRVELAHKITVLSNWAFDPDRDTISALSESQARDINIMLTQIWTIIDRRRRKV
jgi:hypothetical protein